MQRLKICRDLEVGIPKSHIFLAAILKLELDKYNATVGLEKESLAETNSYSVRIVF